MFLCVFVPGQVPLLYNLTEQQLWQLAKSMGTATYKAGQMVFLKGDIGDKFYVVQDGSFSCFESECTHFV